MIHKYEYVGIRMRDFVQLDLEVYDCSAKGSGGKGGLTKGHIYTMNVDSQTPREWLEATIEAIEELHKELNFPSFRYEIFSITGDHTTTISLIKEQTKWWIKELIAKKS